MKNINLKRVVSAFLILSVMTIACEENNNNDDDDNPTNKGTVNMSISDARDAHANDLKSGIINPSDLTECEITISSIQIRNSEGNYEDLLTSATSIDLRNFQGTVSNLLSTEIPIGAYTNIRVTISGVSTTYQGNNYSASTSSTATVSLNNPVITLDESSGVPNTFDNGEIVFELPINFTLANTSDIGSIRLFFDAESSTYIESFTYNSFTWNFAGIRYTPNVSIILEEGIQQIRHSPPMGITLISGGVDVDYYGIHTFVDFNEKGGVINSHTSQHVYRGIDGSLLVDAEDMITNPNPLSPNTVSISGESDIRADETFNYSQMVLTLANAGYTLQHGETYYFSLRKTWNITTDGQTYDLTRICEPIPVTIP